MTPDEIRKVKIRQNTMEPRATLRDQFAMAALVGLMSDGKKHPYIAKTAYGYADAMLENRK